MQGISVSLAQLSSHPVSSRNSKSPSCFPMNAHNVRMSGFRSRTTVDEAWIWCDEFVAQAKTLSETVPLTEACGRCLVEAVVSTLDVPGFDRAAMDGYAVVAEDTTGASDYNPVRLRVVGQSMPGCSYDELVRPQQAVRIMTGAPMPKGATAVVPVEYSQAEGEGVCISTTVGSAKHVGRQGEDIRSGETILSAGRRLRPQDVAVVASIGQSQVIVRQRPKVRLMVTGNELVPPGAAKHPYQIYEANSFLLRGMVARDGGELESVRFVEDRKDSIREALLAPGADVILVSGGSSVGAEDFAPELVAELGTLAMHGIAMRPSSPTGLGQIGNSAVVLLPGNPVSCLCAYDFFAGRMIRQLAGHAAGWTYRMVEVPLARKLVSEIGRVDYCRVKLDKCTAIPLAISGASILSSTTRADGFVVVPAESEGLAAGTSVNVMLYDE